MQWKKTAVNKYPDILLSDCIVDDIQLVNRDLFIDFTKSGLVIKEDSDSQYYRTMEAQIVLENSDIDNITIDFVRRRNNILARETAIVQNVELFTFIKNISSFRWRFEIVEEFYSDLGGIFIGRVRKKKESVWCYIKIYFQNIIYFWNEVDYSNRFN